MSAQKNTLFKYFNKSPAPSSNASPAVGTPKTARVTDSPSTTPKRALASAARGGAQDSPKSTKSVRKDLLVAASPRTRVQRRLLDAALSSPKVYEPYFLRNVLTPQKENEKLMSPVFKALKEHEEAITERNPSTQRHISGQENSPSSEEVIISPTKCSIRGPVRNLNKEFVKSSSKESEEHLPPQQKIECSQAGGSDTGSLDVSSAFGMYVAEEMRRLPSEMAVRSLKKKIMKAILDVQVEQENKKC